MQILFGLLLALQIFLHVKDVVIVFPLLLMLCYEMWRKQRRLPCITLGITFASIAVYLITLHRWFGVWSPSAAYGAGVSFGGGIYNNISAMLFDSSRGLLVYNPILLLIFVGIPIWLKKNRGALAISILAVGPSMIMLADFNQWNGGEAQAGRYIIDFLPVFMPAIAFVIQEFHTFWQKLIVVLLAAITCFISLDATLFRFPIIDAGVYFKISALFSQIQSYTGIALDHLLPTYTTQTEVTVLLSKHGSIKLFLCYALVAALVYYGLFLSRKRRIQTKRTTISHVRARS